MTDAPDSLPVPRIEVTQSFRITGRGEMVLYRLLCGEVSSGMEFLSEQHGDRWQAREVDVFRGPPPPGFTRPPTLLFRPLTGERRIEVGEIFQGMRDKG